MTVLARLADEDLSAEAAEVIADIRATRGTEFVNDFWRVLAHDPALLKATWERLKAVMAPREGGLDPLTKELVYLAVSVANGCSYCVHSHTAAARAKGLTEAQHGEFLAVVAMAATTNALVEGLQVEPDEVFRRG